MGAVSQLNDLTGDTVQEIRRTRCVRLNGFRFAAFNLPHVPDSVTEAGRKEPIDESLFALAWSMLLEVHELHETDEERKQALRLFEKFMGRDEFVAAFSDALTSRLTMFDLRDFFVEHSFRQRHVKTGEIRGFDRGTK